VIEVEQISKEVWLEKYHDKSFQRVFGEGKPRFDDRCNYALVVKKDSVPFAFVTCIEMDAKNVYWQLGGVSGDYQKTGAAMNAMTACLDWSKEKYQSIAMRVENTNLPMVKLALKAEFLIIGTRNFGSEIFLEFLKEFSHG
jgi:hypothetical protein